MDTTCSDCPYQVQRLNTRISLDNFPVHAKERRLFPSSVQHPKQHSTSSGYVSVVGGKVHLPDTMDPFVCLAGSLGQIKAYWVHTTGELLWVLAPLAEAYLGKGSARLEVANCVYAHYHLVLNVHLAAANAGSPSASLIGKKLPYCAPSVCCFPELCRPQPW